MGMYVYIMYCALFASIALYVHAFFYGRSDELQF